MKWLETAGDPLFAQHWPFYPDMRLSTNGRRKLHHHEEASLVKAERERAGWELKVAGIDPVTVFPVYVQWTVVFSNYRSAFDADSLAPAVKPWLDAMTDLKIWPNDSSAYMGKVSYESRVDKDLAPQLRLCVEKMQ